ncbi:MAG: carboxypeptidase-like regulatory domain-containing protein [Bacteroidota bacterium]
MQLTVLGQNKTLTGKVVDENSNPISFANVGLPEHGIGTATNLSGLFDIHIREGFQQDSLVISAIGFETKKIKIADLIAVDSIIISLEPHVLVMKGLTVNALDENAKSIVVKALNNYKTNYIRKKYQLKGFYRQLIRNDETYMLLAEAAFTVFDRGYNKYQDKRVRLDALRKSNDHRDMDSLDIHYDTLMEHNDLMGLLGSDYIDSRRDRNGYGYWPLVNQSMTRNFDFLLDSLSYFDGHLVYCISFFSNRDWMSNKYQEFNRLIIRTGDYAVIEMHVGMKPKEITNSTKEQRGNAAYLVDGWRRLQVIKYRKYKNHWYPYYMSSYGSLVGGDKQKASRLAFEQARQTGSTTLNYKDQSLNGRKIDPDKNNFYSFRELLITEVKDRGDKFRKVKLKEQMDRNQYVRNHKKEYDPDFWKNYNVLLINPFMNKARSDLEKLAKLSEQFPQN